MSDSHREQVRLRGFLRQDCAGDASTGADLPTTPEPDATDTDLPDRWIKLMAVVGVEGVWNRAGFACTTDDLEIPADLKNDICAWADRYSAECEDGLPDPRPFPRGLNSAEGRLLAHRLKAALPDWTVMYFDDARAFGSANQRSLGAPLYEITAPFVPRFRLVQTPMRVLHLLQVIPANGQQPRAVFSPLDADAYRAQLAEPAVVRTLGCLHTPLQEIETDKHYVSDCAEALNWGENLSAQVGEAPAIASLMVMVDLPDAGWLPIEIIADEAKFACEISNAYYDPVTMLPSWLEQILDDQAAVLVLHDEAQRYHLRVVPQTEGRVRLSIVARNRDEETILIDGSVARDELVAHFYRAFRRVWTSPAYLQLNPDQWDDRIARDDDIESALEIYKPYSIVRPRLEALVAST